VLHETMNARLLAAVAETENRQRQLDAIRLEDEAKLAATRRENEALRDEIEATVAGAKRTDVGLVRTRFFFTYLSFLLLINNNNYVVYRAPAVTMIGCHGAALGCRPPRLQLSGNSKWRRRLSD